MLIILVAVVGGLALAVLFTLWLVRVVKTMLRRLLIVSLGGVYIDTPPPSVSPLPTTETILLGAALGVLAGFVHSFGLGAPFPALLQALIAITAAFGVNVITGPAFRNLFHIPQGALVLISMALATVQISVPSWHVGSIAASVIQGVVTLILSLGFGTAVTNSAAARSLA